MTVQGSAVRPFKMNIVSLAGSARERGRIHGESLRPQIRELIAWRQDSIRTIRHVDPDQFSEELVEKSGLYRAVREYTPDLLEEVLGIAEGAGLDRRGVLAWQMLDETGWFLDDTEGRLTRPVVDESCSALGAFGEAGSPTLLAQNVDSLTAFDGHQTLLHMKPKGTSLETFVFTYPGLIGVYGLNSRGVGVCLNAMSGFMNHSDQGLSTLFVARGILARESVTEAVDFVRRVKHATGENYTIGGPDQAVALECSANEVRQFTPYPGATRVYHTNHPLVNNDIRMTEAMVEALPPEARAVARRGRSNSRARFATLEKGLCDTSKPVTVDKIKAILGSHDPAEYPVCRHKPAEPGAMTIACLIMELSGDPTLYVAPGPTCQTEFRSFRF